MSSTKIKKNLLFVFILALALRLIKLDSIPVGFHADEARAGYNAYSILKTGKDDRGNSLALYYNTFGDFRPTGIIYSTIPSIALFGKTEFATRLPSALFGAMTVYPLFYLTLLLTKKRQQAQIASLLMAISPWHISVSRSTSEVVISMFLTLIGLILLIKSGSKKKSKFILLSILFLSLSYFFYHSVRILTPLFVLSIIFFEFRKKITKGPIIILLFTSLLTLFFVSQKEGRKRFNQVSIIKDLDVAYELSRMPFEEGEGKVFIARFFHNKAITYSRRFIKEYAKYISADFLISDAAKPARYITPGIGVLTYIEALLLIVGLISMIKKGKGLLSLILVGVAILPAALTTEDAPNLHRAMFMLPFLITIESYALSSVNKGKLIIKTLLTINFLFFLHMYHVHSPYKIAESRNYGAKEVALFLVNNQNNYDKIILTNIPDSLYPWLGFFGDFKADELNKEAIKRDQGVWTFQNYIFSAQRCPSRDAYKETKEKILVVDAEGCASESDLQKRQDIQIVKEIKRPDESVVYTIWSNK